MISEEANTWLATGQRGISSEAIFSHLTGINVVGKWGKRPPSDPADFMRCRELLEQVPEFKDRLHDMADVSETWARLVDAWGELCDLMDLEAPEWRARKGSAPETYKRMRELSANAKYTATNRYSIIPKIRITILELRSCALRSGISQILSIFFSADHRVASNRASFLLQVSDRL